MLGPEHFVQLENGFELWLNQAANEPERPEEGDTMLQQFFGQAKFAAPGQDQPYDPQHNEIPSAALTFTSIAMPIHTSAQPSTSTGSGPSATPPLDEVLQAVAAHPPLLWFTAQPPPVPATTATTLTLRTKVRAQLDEDGKHLKVPCANCKGLATINGHNDGIFCTACFNRYNKCVEQSNRIPSVDSPQPPVVKTRRRSATLAGELNHIFHPVPLQDVQPIQLGQSQYVLTHESAAAARAYATHPPAKDCEPLNLKSDDYSVVENDLYFELCLELQAALCHVPGPPLAKWDERTQMSYRQNVPKNFKRVAEHLQTQLQIDMVQARIMETITAAVEYHKFGIPLVLTKGTSKRGLKPDTSLRCLERVKKIIAVVKVSPEAKADLVQGQCRDDLVLSPGDYLERKYANMKTNTKKGEQLKKAKGVKDVQMEEAGAVAENQLVQQDEQQTLGIADGYSHAPAAPTAFGYDYYQTTAPRSPPFSFKYLTPPVEPDESLPQPEHAYDEYGAMGASQQPAAPTSVDAYRHTPLTDGPPARFQQSGVKRARSDSIEGECITPALTMKRARQDGLPDVRTATRDRFDVADLPYGQVGPMTTPFSLVQQSAFAMPSHLLGMGGYEDDSMMENAEYVSGLFGGLGEAGMAVAGEGGAVMTGAVSGGASTATMGHQSSAQEEDGVFKLEQDLGGSADQVAAMPDYAEEAGQQSGGERGVASFNQVAHAVQASTEFEEMVRTNLQAFLREPALQHREHVPGRQVMNMLESAEGASQRIKTEHIDPAAEMLAQGEQRSRAWLEMTDTNVEITQGELALRNGGHEPVMWKENERPA